MAFARGTLIFGPLVLLAATFAADPPAWKFDRIVATNGSVFRGLILDETPALVRFQAVRQQPGRPTVVFSTTFTRAEVDRIERLSDAERDELRTRLRDLDPQLEKFRVERLELEAIPWNGKPAAGKRYRSDQFVLESDAPEAIVRRAAVRLEQVYAAYARFLPPRVAREPTPTTVLLLKSRKDYAARLVAEGRRLVNVGYFDPAANRVVCASDLESLGNDLERARQQSQQLRGDYDARELLLGKLYKGKELLRHVQPIRTARTALDAADRRNESVFDVATQQLFATLYHEAFHAYLAGFVYPSPTPGPPRWLNEGLAQIFETAVIDGGELRVGHADRERLTRAKEAARKGEFVPVARLLRATPNDFLAAHADDRAATDASYLTAWAIAFHLTFERRMLGGTALDAYFRELANGVDAAEAFATLVAKSPDEYERELGRYLTVLQPDGSKAAPLPEKDR